MNIGPVKRIYDCYTFELPIHIRTLPHCYEKHFFFKFNFLCIDSFIESRLGHKIIWELFCLRCVLSLRLRVALSLIVIKLKINLIKYVYTLFRFLVQ